MQRWTGELSAQKSVTLGRAFFRAVAMAWATSSDTPSPLEAVMGTTGIPRAVLSLCTSTVPPLAYTSSIMFSASTMGTFSSRSWSVRYRLRSILVASTMLMIPSGFRFRIKSRETISSWV